MASRKINNALKSIENICAHSQFQYNDSIPKWGGGDRGLSTPFIYIAIENCKNQEIITFIFLN